MQQEYNNNLYNQNNKNHNLVLYNNNNQYNNPTIPNIVNQRNDTDNMTELEKNAA